MITVVIACDNCKELIERAETKDFNKVSAMLWAWDQEQMIQQEQYHTERSSNLLCSHCFKLMTGEIYANQ